MPDGWNKALDTKRLNANGERSRRLTSQSSFLVDEKSSHSSFLVELGHSQSSFLIEEGSSHSYFLAELGTSQSSFLVEEGSPHSSFLVELGASKSAILAARLRSNIFTRSHGITDTNTAITIQH